MAEKIDGTVTALSDRAANHVLDIGVLRRSIAELDEKAQTVREPFDGHQVSAVARLLDVRVLPTDRLRICCPEPRFEAAVGVGPDLGGGTERERVRPQGRVDCSEPLGLAQPPTETPQPDERSDVPGRLAQTNAAYSAVPLFWSGTVMLLVGVVLVAALPNRKNREPAPVKPSPRPRGE